MKKLLFIVVIASGIMACKSDDKKGTVPVGKMTPEEIEKAKTDSTQFTSIQWIDSSTRSLGKLVKDQEIEVTFRFKNSGDKMLVIEKVSAGCGCTIPEQPKEPFAPGQEGVIKAKFNGSGSGTISKNVTVIANTKPYKEHTLIFTGEIVEKK
jgi:Protein of unknown function (DUF1573)